MSTFERMLQVLGNRDAACRGGSVANVLSRVVAESRSGAGRRARRRVSSRRGRRHTDAPFATEQLEQRQLLAVTTFAQAPYLLGSGAIAEGWATVVAEGGDNVFIQQVAGKSQSLWVADNSSFNNATVVGGPAAGTAANWQLPGVDVNTLSSIQVTAGTVRRDVNVLPAGYPMFADSTTRFTLNSDGLDTFGRELSGTISIEQPDGRTESWTFSNAGRFGFDGEPTFRTGINSETAKTGEYYPTAIRVVSRGSQTLRKSEIEVVWNVPRLPVTPRLESVQWYCFYSYSANNQDQDGSYVQNNQYQSGVRPAAGARTFIPLPNAAGPGLSPILPATFSGTIIVDGVSLNVTAGDPNSPTTLRFNGESEGLIRGYRDWFGPANGWFADDWMHTISGRLLTGTQADGYQRGLELTMSGDFPVLLESARYALPAGGDPVTATVFAGQNITSALDVNLVQPGSSFRLDSPVLVAAGRSGISVRASSVEFNAPASTSADLTVGPAQVDSAQALEAASAVAQIVDGKLSKIILPSGGWGAGYDADNLPTVRIDEPTPSANPSRRAAKATAIVDRATTRIVGFEITDRGDTYDRVPNVTISPPLAVSNAIRPLATIDAGGRVTGVTFGFGTGLKVLVTGVSNTTKGITNVIVEGGAGGSGYAVGDLVSIDSSGQDRGQAGQFRVLEINQSGSVLRVEIVNPGVGYGQGELLTHAGSANRGYGYTGTPRVYISRPDSADGTQAEAEAAIDLAGRITGITVTKPGSGYKTAPLVTVAAVSPVAQAETLKFNTSVAARNYRIDLADDPSTNGVVRTTLFVANSGSLTGNLAGTASASTIFVQSRQGDVLLEGTVQADTQSYVLQSGPEDQTLMPFRFTTMTAGSSTPSGWIKGGTVAVTLANDLDTPEKGAVAYNTVTVRTQVDSIRIRAAKRNGAAITEPFPYQLSLSEYPNSTGGGDPLGSIAIDAVAASSFPILLAATGNLDFNATLATAGGLAVTGVNAFTVTAPVSTTKGQIKIDAAAITVKNSLRVTDAADDKAQQDIILNARNGDVILDGGYVSAKNRVVINQKRRLPVSRTFSSSSGQQTITDRSTASMSVAVPAGLSIDDLNVALDVTHPDLGDLSATLIAPDGSAIQLFATNRLSGANLTGSVFDSEAEADLPAGKAPYTGSFRPAQSLSTLYSKSPTGIWTVRVTDSFFNDIGTLNAFRITLRDVLGSTGGQVAGTSRLKADTLVVDAEGSIGKTGLLPGDSGAYLLTDVDTVIARAGYSLAISDASDLNVDTLVAGGIVSLRAEGVDPVVDKTTGKATVAALRGTLTDVQSLDVSAPNGSIDLKINTATETVLGNAAGLGLAEDVRRDRLPSMVAAGSVSVRSVGGSTGGDFVVMDAPLAGSSAKPVRFVTTVQAADVTYVAGTPGIYASSITAKVNGAITTSLFASLFGGAGTPPSPLKVGDRVLVANDTTGGDNMNGVYAVSRLGGVSTTWQLIRVTDGDTAAELPSNTIVRVQEGQNAAAFYRLVYPVQATAIVTGNPNGRGSITTEFVQITNPGGGYIPDSKLPLKITGQGFGAAGFAYVDASGAVKSLEITSGGDGYGFGNTQISIPTPAPLGATVTYDGLPFGSAPITAVPITVTTNIGSNDPSDVVRFVVSTPDGTNISPGSLGKMISLRQANDPRPNETQAMEFAFSPSVGDTIKLRQELPQIVKPFTIDGRSRYPAASSSEAIAIDGSRIDTTRDGNAVSLSTTVDGIVFAATSGSSKAEEAGALRNMVLGGFSQGTAVIVNGSNVQVDNVVVGENVDGGRLGVRNGMVVNADDVTISGNSISSASGVALEIKGKAFGSKIFGNTIGKNGRDNASGIEVTTTGRNVIGDKNQAPNVVSYNGTGIKLASSAGTEVINSVVTLNNGDGILITAGSNVIGSDKAPDPLKPLALGANQIAMNKGWGVRIRAATLPDATSLANDQKIFGNYFVVPDAPKNDITKQNQPRMTKAPGPGTDTAVGISTTLASNDAGTLYQGDAGNNLQPYPADYTDDRTKAGLDPSGNQHFGIGDNTGPSLAMLSPVDVQGVALGPSIKPTDATVQLIGADASRINAFVFNLQDTGSGLLSSTIVKEAFTVKRDSSTLIEGRDYKFVFPGTSPTMLRFETIGVDAFPLGAYQIEANSTAGREASSGLGGFTGGRLTDKDNNVLQGTAMFTVTLAVAQAPTNVVAEAGDGSASIAWVQPVDAGGAVITDFAIESSSNGGSTWSTIADGVSTVPVAAIRGLTNGVSYVFRVTAITSYGRGAASQVSAAVVPMKAASAPLALLAVGGDSGATLSWTVPASTGGTAITDYSIQRSVDGGNTWIDVVDPVTATTGAAVTGLTNGTSYVFRVAAKTAAGLGAWTAASAAVVPLKTASAPRSLQVTPGDRNAVLTWLSPESTGGSPVTDYIAQRSSNGGQTWVTVSDSVTATTTMTATGLDNGTTYSFRVAAVTLAGPGPWTAASQGAVPRGPATVPLDVRGTVGDGQVALTWTAPTSTGGSTLRDYLVQSSTDGGQSWSTVADGVSANTGATVRGLNNGTSYAFRVAALTDFATGAYSPATAAIVPLAVPGQITGLQVQAGAGRVNLNWQAPANSGGRPVSDYTIEYSVAGTATWVPWAHAASTATSATITGLATNVGYLFRVTTVTSFATAQAVATTEAVVPGQPPTRLAGRAANGAVVLAWLPPRVAGPSRITDYRIQYSLDGVNWITAVDGVSAASRATVRGLANGSSYTFRVAAITAKGVGSYSAVSARLTPRAR